MKHWCLREQFIPQLFKFNGCLHSAFSTKKRNHLPEPYNSLLNISAANQWRNGGQESLAASRVSASEERSHSGRYRSEPVIQ